MMTQTKRRMVWWCSLIFLFGRVACFIDQDVHHQRRAGHHSNYEVCKNKKLGQSLANRSTDKKQLNKCKSRSQSRIVDIW